jgi:anti-anti-sigma factor
MSSITLEDFQTISASETLVIAVPQRLSALEAPSFRDRLTEVFQSCGQAGKILLDFRGTTFIDSSGVGALAAGIKQSKARQISLAVTGLTQQVEAVLKLTGLNTLLAVEDASSGAASSHAGETVELPVTHPSVRSRIKRTVDILGSMVGLALTGMALVPIAIAIKLDSPGPIFFRQTRCGWMGTRFRLYKFRSMSADAEQRKHQVKNEAQGAIFKNAADPRITRVGRFLRRTSLDELPQFWNVLQGSMSLVGTRPPTPDEIDQYDVPEWQRLDVKPGITGEWQVNGRSSVKNFQDVIALDLKYQRNWSLWYDLRLILKTVRVVFSKDSGAL